jgi:mannan endo-1,4-beta-mannosidase
VRRITIAALASGLTMAVIVACVSVLLHRPRAAHSRTASLTGDSCGHPDRPGRYIGVITPGPPGGADLASFIHQTGVRPSIVPYFVSFGSSWNPVPACRILRAGALPVIQVNPRKVSLSAIAAGRRDAYLAQYAQHVRAFHAPVVISFGHEMNGYWYSWGHRHTSPAVFVAAWRHIVTVFRRQRADNVTWLWTVNIIDRRGGIPSPAPWWPGDSFVDWVGIDGYYYKPSWRFAPLFGPTIRAVRALTLDPILITETAVAPAAGQPAKIADLFAGVRAYGLLGFVWFNCTGFRDWRLTNPAAIAALRQGARASAGSAS